MQRLGIQTPLPAYVERHIDHPVPSRELPFRICPRLRCAFAKADRDADSGLWRSAPLHQNDGRNLQVAFDQQRLVFIAAELKADKFQIRCALFGFRCQHFAVIALAFDARLDERDFADITALTRFWFTSTRRFRLSIVLFCERSRTRRAVSAVT